MRYHDVGDLSSVDCARGVPGYHAHVLLMENDGKRD